MGPGLAAGFAPGIFAARPGGGAFAPGFGAGALSPGFGAGALGACFPGGAAAGGMLFLFLSFQNVLPLEPF